MQLADQIEEPDQKMSPSIYAALVDSLFQNPAPLFAGAVLRRRGGDDDGGQDRQTLLWPCVALLIVTGAVRAFDMHWYKNAQIRSDRR